MNHLFLSTLAISLSLLVPGCSGEPEVVSVAIPKPIEAAAAAQTIARGPSIVVLRFEDVRREKGALGVRTGRLGALDSYTFVVASGDLGESMSTAMRAYLRAQGWYIKGSRGVVPDTPDFFLHGELRELRVEGVNNWFTTTTTCRLSLLVQGENRADGSRIEVPIDVQRESRVGWFQPTSVETLVNGVLAEGFQQLVKGIRFDGNQVVLVHP